jgi:hypothetical protein
MSDVDECWPLILAKRGAKWLADAGVLYLSQQKLTRKPASARSTA